MVTVKRLHQKREISNKRVREEKSVSEMKFTTRKMIRERLGKIK